MLERIVYISVSRVVQDEESICRILDTARARNAACGITGLLIGGSGWFMQLIEGETCRLEPIWQSIRDDPRHDPVVLVQRRRLRERDFNDWDLKFRTAENAEFGSLVEEMTGGIRDRRLRDQVKRFTETFLTVHFPFSDLAA